LPAVARIGWIDGLRGVAILSVVGFHAGAPGFSGGFTAIDVFFVISGFLICGQIVDGIRDGTFSFAEFYARRAARIFPPLLLVVGTVLVAATLLPLLPGEVERLASSGRAAAAMVSNWYFIDLGEQYFWPSAEREVFLHTWSLGVEEQFYLMAPAFTLLVYTLAVRRGLAPLRVWIATTIAIVALSFAATVLFGRAQSQQMFVYYSTPTRLWELALGALVALLVRHDVRLPRAAGEIAAAAGLATIVAMVVWVHPELGVNRAFIFAPPALGTCALLLAGHDRARPIACRVLGAAPLVGLGVVSYGYYLWHWPVPALMQTLQLEPLSARQIIVGMAIVPLLLGIATYWTVERPLRRWRSRAGPSWSPRLVAAGGLAACGVLAAAASGVVVWSHFTAADPQFRSYEVFSDARDACREGFTGQPRCTIGPGPVRRVLVWGDSHAIGLSGATAAAARDARTGAYVVWGPGCPPLLGAYWSNAMWNDCLDHNARVLAWLRSRAGSEVTSVVLVAGWAAGILTVEEITARFRATIDALADLGLRVLVVGPPPMLPRPGPECVFRARGNPTTCWAPRTEVAALFEPVMTSLSAVVDHASDADMVDPTPVFCDATWCRPTYDDQLLYSDSKHLSGAGALRLYDRYRSQFAWVFAPAPRTRAGSP
jgi:peptidoglycan/LPS O-acetylase OafA/YrhL